MDKYQLMVDLYKQGYSSYDLGKMFSMRANSIQYTLRKHGVLRRTPGYREEKRFFKWISDWDKYPVKRMNGCHSFDILVGNYRINVKSSNSSVNGGYYFELKHKDGSDFVENTDFFIFIFDGQDIFIGKTSDFIGRKSVRMKKTDIRINFIGKLAC